MTAQAVAGVSARPCLNRNGETMTSERTRIKNKGRDVKSRPFLQLYDCLTGSPVWRFLSGSAKGLFIDIARLYNGTNNGYITYAYSTAQKNLGFSSRTANKAFNELIEKGFIEPVKKGIYRGNATEWRITCFKDDRTGASPTNEWQQYQNDEKSNQ